MYGVLLYVLYITFLVAQFTAAAARCPLPAGGQCGVLQPDAPFFFLSSPPLPLASHPGPYCLNFFLSFFLGGLQCVQPHPQRMGCERLRPTAAARGGYGTRFQALRHQPRSAVCMYGPVSQVLLLPASGEENGRRSTCLSPLPIRVSSLEMPERHCPHDTGYLGLSGRRVGRYRVRGM